MGDLRMMTIAREVGVNIRDAMAALGCAFNFNWIDTNLAAGASAYARVTLGDKYLILFNRELAASQEEVWYRAYFGAGAGTPGAAVNVSKVRADSSIDSVISGNFETAPDLGPATKVAEVPAFGGGSGAAAAGHETSEGVLRIYPPGSVFTLQLENLSASATKAHLHLFWWEVSAEFLPPVIEV